MMYYFKSCLLRALPQMAHRCRPALQTNPMMAVMNSMSYDAMTLGNHEFNFGSARLQRHLQAGPVPAAGRQRRGYRRVRPSHGRTRRARGHSPTSTKTLGGIKVAILGITNHRVPNYELPSNIPGLTFSNPIATGQQSRPRSTGQQRRGDRPDPHRLHHQPEERRSGQQCGHQPGGRRCRGIDAIIGSHSHTNPAKPRSSATSTCRPSSAARTTPR